MTVKEKDELAKKMRTSRRYLDLNYIKILPNTQTQTPTTAATIATIEPKQEELNAYQKQLRSNNYYENNKEKVLNKQKSIGVKFQMKIKPEPKLFSI
jgi:hypothetical protein